MPKLQTIAAMRLPIRVATAVRARKLLPPGARVLVGLSGGPDSVALLRCLLELARKRDFGFSLAAAHLNHALRGRAARQDQVFCRKLCAGLGVDFIEARCETRKLAAHLKRSVEEAGRIARHAFLAHAAQVMGCASVAVAHHADDRIETVLFRLSRGTGLAGLEGIGWDGPLVLAGEPDVQDWLKWQRDGKPAPRPFAPRGAVRAEQIVRPLLGCRREEILEYLRSRRQRFRTDETNFDTRIPRNALRRLVLPVLEKKVHPGARAALWRLAEEAEFHAERRAWHRGWLDGIAAIGARGYLALPAPKVGGPPSLDELSDVLGLLKTIWGLSELEVSTRHLQLVRGLFGRSGAHRRAALPGRLTAERRGSEVHFHRV